MGAPASAPPGADARLFGAITVAALVLFGALARGHAVNADEGFYLAAGRDVAAGLRPYADFFYPQMPYLPYAEALLFSVTGVGLFAGRLLSVVPAALLAGVLAVAAAGRTGRHGVGIAVAAAYALHALSLGYLTILKTYGLSNLLFICALLLIVAGSVNGRRAAIAGACAALAAGLRLPTVAVLLVLFLWTLRSGMRPAAAFAAGATIAGLPLLLIAGQDPQAFWFGNIGFHELRREIVGYGPILGQKAGVLLKWIVLPQNLILWCLAAAGWWRGAARETCAALAATALGVLYLYATPTYLEYMCQLIPLLLIAGTPAFAWLLDRRGLAGAVTALYLIGLAVAMRPAAAGSTRALKNELWNLTTVEAVADHLRRQSEPEDTVLSWWEGYPVLADRPGFRDVGFWHSNVAKKMPGDLRRRYHVAAVDDVQQLIEEGRPRFVVCQEGEWQSLRGALEAGYERTAVFGRIEVFRRRERASANGIAARSSGER